MHASGYWGTGDGWSSDSGSDSDSACQRVWMWMSVYMSMELRWHVSLLTCVCSCLPSTALAAKMCGLEAHIVMPSTAPAVKQQVGTETHADGSNMCVAA